VPDIVSDEFFNGFLPLFLQQPLIIHHSQLVHQAINVLNQNVVSCNQHLLLRIVRWLPIRLNRLLHL
jgi:hypothetical protein